MRPRAWALSVIAGLGLFALCMPQRPEPLPQLPEGAAFAWDQDHVWSQLQTRFEVARQTPCPTSLAPRLADLAQRASSMHEAEPSDPRWAQIEQGLFELTADLAACPSQAGQLLTVRNAIWRAAKDASTRWPATREARDRLYRLLYGSRAATEALILQLPLAAVPALNIVDEVASATPSIEIEGVTIHSGDLLVSRGGAPTSAFIARGSDYPGNFSHVALVHVDEGGTAQIIEAHIERGVAIATPQAYFADKKLRILVLRPRPDLRALEADPQLPHRVAEAALAEARARHIPYDFAMDFADPHAQFCSEVASTHYADHGVMLWRNLSVFSSPGLARWMAALGVRNFETHGPSDLEYDPQLAVVAEWADRETLFEDHVDAAVIDVMLEGAQRGDPLRYSMPMLPIGRLAKAYSAVLNAMGKEGPVPEGMSATVALRATWLAAKHDALVATVLRESEAFETARGRRPAYWELVELARAAAQAS